MGFFKQDNDPCQVANSTCVCDFVSWPGARLRLSLFILAQVPSLSGDPLFIFILVFLFSFLRVANEYGPKEG